MAMHDAARSGDVAALRAAIASDPTAVNSRDKHSRTPLHLAAWAGKADAVKLLCEGGKADVGAIAMDNMASIHFASQKGHTQVVRELLCHGASINAQTRKGLTALHFAAQGGHGELAILLARRGANAAARSKAGKTPVEVAKDDELRRAMEAELQALQAKKESKKKAEKAGKNEDQDEQQATNESKNKVETEAKNEDRDEEQAAKRSAGDKTTDDDDEPKAKKPKVTLSHLVEDEEAC